MTDYTELKRLADDLNSAIEKAEHKPGQWAGTAQSMGGICCPVAPFDISKPWAKEEPWANFSFKRDSWLAVAAVNALPQLLALIADNERLTNRLEVDPRHDYDGISTRDATVKVLDEQVDQLKADNERLRADYAGLARFNPEWDRVAAAQDSVREHMAMVVQLKAENAGLKTGYEAYERVNAELKAENEALRKDSERAAYWKQRAKSAEGHLFSGDFRAAAMELHKYSRFESTPWPELTGSQRALISSAAGAVIATVNGLRDTRRPKSRDESDGVAWCACGDGHAANSYGAGFMDANSGVCANCDAANPASKEASNG